MYFDNFTQEEKDYFEEKLGDLITDISDDEITIDDDENCDHFIILKYPCHKGTLYLLQMEDDPDGIFEVSDGVWMPNSQYVYYEITKEGIEQFAADGEERYSLREYTLSNLGK